MLLAPQGGQHTLTSDTRDLSKARLRGSCSCFISSSPPQLAVTHVRAYRKCQLFRKADGESPHGGTRRRCFRRGGRFSANSTFCTKANSNFSNPASEYEGLPLWAALLQQWLTCSCGMLQLLDPPIRHSCIPSLWKSHFAPFTCSSHPLSFFLLSHFTPQSNPGCLLARIPQHPGLPLVRRWVNNGTAAVHVEAFLHSELQIRRQHSTCPTYMCSQLQQSRTERRGPFYGLPGGPSSIAPVYVCIRMCVRV